MEANQVRQKFLEFFKSKDHEVVASAPMVIKNDPTLMFTNAGMNQFKDLFLGNSPIVHSRIADTQKCLRVSGKHNDLEEVGRDTYHHTMFEMLGNWSFGDYFKKEAIEWGWELLTDIYNIDKSRLYVTVFGGATDDGLPADEEAKSIWKKIVTEDKIIFGSKKDNFWEMGDTGPCGPCSEIHIDLRPESEIIQIPGKELVNKDHPQVIEIWNLVFIQYNRLSDGSLKELPARHVDTGMGFERLCRVIQGKSSNYDTDVFQPLILAIAKSSGINYGKDEKTDIAMRVIADHLRAIAFSTADGQLPSNTGAGYVIRRILRRAVRYGYSFLGFSEPFMCKIVPVLVKQLGNQFPELSSQEQLISKVIFEEETSFLRTLQTGLERIGKHIKATSNKVIAGEIVFELYDTYGFPPDLTSLIARENGFEIDQNGFQKALEEQKNRSRQAAKTETEDWVELCTAMHTEFLGYDTLEVEAKILKYRKIITKNKDLFQIVLDKTPFYAESGGQVGDAGLLVIGNEN
ncbi:MAG: alanine--tRNA ligase, partial [Bacteroidetes bacterium]|nr:alanine--tRNA ligase [Bacteroidota bacterium]